MVSLFNYTYTTWKVTTLDHRVQLLPRCGSRVANFLAWFAWFEVAKVTCMISLTVLALIGWLEMFSNDVLFPFLPAVNEFAVPMIILYLTFPINNFLHQKFVQEDDPYTQAHGTNCAVFPRR